MKKWIESSIVLVLYLVLGGCEKESEINIDSEVIQTTFEINGGQDIEMQREDTLQLTYQIIPFKSKDSVGNLTWISFDQNVAIISPQGELITINPGVTRIALTNENKTIGDTINLKVTPIPLGNYILENNRQYVLAEEGKNYKINVAFIPNNADDKKLTWEIYRWSQTDTKISQDGSFTPMGIKPFAICVRHSIDPIDIVDSYCAKSIKVLVSSAGSKITGNFMREYDSNKQINLTRLLIGSLKQNFSLKNVKLYKTSGFTFNKTELIKEKDFSLSVESGKVEVVDLFEVSDEVANTLSLGSLISCLVSIDEKDYILEILADNDQIRILEQK